MLRPAAAAIVLLAAGCAGSGPGAAGGDEEITPVTATQARPQATVQAPFEGERAASSEGTYVVVFRPMIEDLPLNEMFSMEVRLFEADGATPVGPGVDLAVDAAMPAHRHGMNTRPRVTRSPGGRFEVAGMLLHMPGDWELYFDATRDGLTERAQVAVNLE